MRTTVVASLGFVIRRLRVYERNVTLAGLP
jgi:hypothetical protein